MRMLLIDDELPSLEIMQDVLEPAGHKCVIYQNPKQAVEAYKMGEFDLVLTDFKMPGMNGIEVLKSIKEYNPKAKVIILTGYADIYNAIEAVNNGAYAFFRKPVKVNDFMDTIDKLEEEINDEDKRKINVNRLSEEYKNLKKSYNKLKKVLEEVTAEQVRVFNE